jgi:hypothetical protein
MFAYNRFMKCKLKKLISALVLSCIFVSGALAGTFKHITIDGSFEDWAGVPMLASQAQLPNVSVAFKDLYLANDENYLYIRFSLYNPTNPFSSKQNIFLDANNNAATGYSAHGIGSEMLIQNGNAYRETNGVFNAGTINGLDWQASPAAPASEFEARISRGATYTNGVPVFAGNSVALILESDESGGAAWFPSTSGGITYTFEVATNASYGQDLVTNFYTVSTEEFANPERGFYIQADNYASAPSSVPGNLASYRINGKNSPGNTYSAKISLLLRLFYLDSFTNSPISSNFLNAIQNDFDSIRAQGDKVILRFAYTKNTTRPFGEPTKARILSHIEQLKPLLKKNSDIIAVLQMGMIAAWGEGYYTDVFYTNGQATAQNWLDRNEVLNAELDALPPDRMVQVRVPQFKQKYVYGTNAPTSSAPIAPGAAFSGSNIARIGFHNDCYLASSTDYGTFSDNDFGAGTSSQDVSNLRNYLAQETRFAPMGGETCNVYPPTTDCASAGGNADLDMAFAHYSFLNEGYNASVNDQWAAQGCIEDIKRRLGYRLGLISGIFRTEAQPGQAIPLMLNFTNAGFASLYNPRGLELVLRNTATGKKFFAALSRDTDARRWLSGTNYVVNAQLSLPSDIPLGDYEMLLNLPDPATSLYTNTAYSIRLANSNAVSSSGTVLKSVWEANTGYHRLGQILTINSTATNAAPSGAEIPVLNFSSIAETYDTWRARNFPLNPGAGSPEADPDGDSRPNLLEYAIGSNPNVRDDSNCLNVSFTNDSLFLSIPKGPGVKDVDFEIQGSTTLAPASWSTSSVAILKNDASALNASYPGLSSSAFLRLKVTLE